MRKYILDNFDFEKCALTMRFLGWRWAFSPGPVTVEDLKKTANYLMDSAIEGCLKSKDCRSFEPYHSATGGLKVSCMKNKFKMIDWIELEFVLTEWSCDGDL